MVSFLFNQLYFSPAGKKKNKKKMTVVRTLILGKMIVDRAHNVKHTGLETTTVC